MNKIKISKFHYNKSIYDLCKIPFVSMLLKNDVLIFGEFIVNFLLNETTIKPYKTVNCFAKSVFKNIIERDLFKYKFSEQKLTDKNIYTYDTYLYKLNVNSDIYYLYINYISDIKKIDYNLMKSNTLIYSDLIGLDRNGLHILPYYDDLLNDIHIKVPVPFLTVLDSIFNKSWTVISSIETVPEFNRLINLLKSGWTNAYSKLSIVKIKPEQPEICTICRDNIKLHHVKLPCSHIFHKTCWYENMKFSISQTNTNNIINCPVCRKEYNFMDVI